MKENIEMKGNDTEQCKKDKTAGYTTKLLHFLIISLPLLPTVQLLTASLPFCLIAPQSHRPTVSLPLNNCLTPYWPIVSLPSSQSRCYTAHHLSGHPFLAALLSLCHIILAPTVSLTAVLLLVALLYSCPTVKVPQCHTDPLSKCPTAHCLAPNFPMSRCLTAPL